MIAFYYTISLSANQGFFREIQKKRTDPTVLPDRFFDVKNQNK